MWKVSHVSFTNGKPFYLGCPIKVVIHMTATTFEPVLQSTVAMPTEPTPSEDIATLLDSPNQQRVDVLALVVGVGEARLANTGSGQRTIVDVTIRDQSGPSGASECEFPLFFKKSPD